MKKESRMLVYENGVVMMLTMVMGWYKTRAVGREMASKDALPLLLSAYNGFDRQEFLIPVGV